MSVSHLCRIVSPVIARRVSVTVAAFVVAVAFAAPDAYAQKKKGPKNFDVVPITITGVTYTGGTQTRADFLVSGLAGAQPFQTPLVVTAKPGAGPCPILNLALGPINLTLLGLNVDTSAICLEVTAIPGGGLLGDLLCSVANLLNGGLLGGGLPNLAAGITPAQMTSLQNGLTSLLDQTFDALTSSENVNIAQASCSVLSLAIGPLDLNLLGLRVELDDCEGGPVTVDITATPGGGLLGDLLCNLSNLLNRGNASAAAIAAALREIARALAGLLA